MLLSSSWKDAASVGEGSRSCREEARAKTRREESVGICKNRRTKGESGRRSCVVLNVVMVEEKEKETKSKRKSKVECPFREESLRVDNPWMFGQTPAAFPIVLLDLRK